MNGADKVIPWFIIFLCLCGVILASSFFAALLAPLSSKAQNETEAPDFTRAPGINLKNMPLVTKDPAQPEWYLYSSGEPTRDDDDDMDAFRKNIVRR